MHYEGESCEQPARRVQGVIAAQWKHRPSVTAFSISRSFSGDEESSMGGAAG
jgi:hypothetical protein